MPYIDWKNLSPTQRLDAVKVRPQWHTDDFKSFSFWVRQDGCVSQRPGHHQLLESAYQAAMGHLKATPRSKGDLADWKPGTTFHFSRG